MSEQSILGSVYKAFSGLTHEGININYDPPTSAEIEPGVLRLKDNRTIASFGSGPGTFGWIGGSGIGQGTSLVSANDALTRINDVIHFAGKLYHWNANNIWEYNPQSEALPGSGNATWTIAATPTSTSNNHVGLYGVTVSGQARLATVAIESAVLGRGIIYNPITDTWDSGNTGAISITTQAQGLYAETTFNNKIYFVGSTSDVNVFDPEKLDFVKLPIPGTALRPFDFQPFQGKMYMLSNTTSSGSLIWNVDLVTGVTVAAVIPQTDGSGAAPGAFSDANTRNVLFMTANSGHATGGSRWPAGGPGGGIPTPHMVAMISMASSSGSSVDGYGTFAIINNGTRFNHSMEAVPCRFSIHPFPHGSFFNGPLQQGQGNVARAFVDDTSPIGIAPGSNEQHYIQFRTWTLSNEASNIYFPHSKDGSYRWNWEYEGPSTDMTQIDTAVVSGQADNATAAISFPQHYAGGHRYHAPGQMDIYVTDIEQGPENGLENDNMRVKFRVVNNTAVPNGTPVNVRLMYAQFNGGPTKGTGILENPSTGSIFDSTRMDIAAVDSGTVYSVEWNNKDQGFLDTEEVQFTLYVTT